MPSTDTYTLSLHDALPISLTRCEYGCVEADLRAKDLIFIFTPEGVFESTYPLDDVTSHQYAGWHGRFVAQKKRKKSRRLNDRVDRKSTRLNSSHLGISYAVHRHLHSFPTRRSSDLTDPMRIRVRRGRSSRKRPDLHIHPGRCLRIHLPAR